MYYDKDSYKGNGRERQTDRADATTLLALKMEEGA